MKNSFEREKHWLLEEKHNGKETKKFSVDLKKLKNGVPLAYIIGNVPFYDCLIDLQYKPLIPRVETEHWVYEFVKKELKNQELKKQVRILDIFSGSGCIGISILKNTLNTKVDFADIKPKYLKQIKLNLELNKVSKKRFEIIQSDVFKKIPIKKYDYILANPPYISKDRLNTVSKSVIEHEDKNALFAKNDGLYFILKLIKESQKYLTFDGKVYVEFDSWQKKKIEKILKAANIKNYQFVKDQCKKDRLLIFSYN